ncbi:SMI1/KNR4 family protein [Streptomyces sp. NPDC017979]|uniref:SMI1/KNR4 family protein n=1 Tax=Streptomyces sp. NPDC017979 TaxID=3365024 RepID=UPI0037B1DE87
MMSGILPAWTAITDWLAAHAPASHAALQPGATPSDVRTAEAELGVALPADLMALLAVCNGTVDASALERDPDEHDPGLFVAQHHLLPLAEITAVRESVGGPEDFWGAWVPFAVADYSLAPWGGLAIDPDGRLAGFSLANGEPPALLVAPGHRTLAEFLDALAEALTRGTGPLTGEIQPGLHHGSPGWGRPPGGGAPLPPARPGTGPTD